jgi:alanyl-tRNA synthetase
MKHLLDRNDFLTQSRMNEGIIGDTFRKGVKKLKDMFSLLYKKVKNFIAIFDSKGNVLPVVSLQACVDHFAGVKGVEVVTSKEINDSIKKVGGQTGGTTISLSNDNESYEDVDKDSVEYKNLMSIPKILKESFGGEQLDERISYSEAGEGLNIPTIDIEEFKEKILGRIVDRQKKKRKGNMLIFGAPGIGKSSIANSVKEAYNRSKSNEQGISIITINCADSSR